MDAIDHNYEPPKIETPTGNPEEWLIGLTAERGRELLLQRGCTLRIAEYQGVQAMITADHRAFRWNVGVDLNGKIVEVFGRG